MKHRYYIPLLVTLLFFALIACGESTTATETTPSTDTTTQATAPAHILTDAEAQQIAQQYLVNETVVSAKSLNHDGKASLVLAIAEDDTSIGHTSDVMNLVATGFENQNVSDIAFAFGNNNGTAKYICSVTFSSDGSTYTSTQPQPVP